MFLNSVSLAVNPVVLKALKLRPLASTVFAPQAVDAPITPRIPAAAGPHPRGPAAARHIVASGMRPWVLGVSCTSRPSGPYVSKLLVPILGMIGGRGILGSHCTTVQVGRAYSSPPSKAIPRSSKTQKHLGNPTKLGVSGQSQQLPVGVSPGSHSPPLGDTASRRGQQLGYTYTSIRRPGSSGGRVR